MRNDADKSVEPRLFRPLKYMAAAAAALVAFTPAVRGQTPHGIDYFTAPFRIERILDRGERPDWSRDGRKIAFTESDMVASPAYEIDVATRQVRCLTCRWGANGLVTRIYYLPSGNFLVLGPPGLGTARFHRDGKPHSDPATSELYWMPASLAVPPQRLDAPAWGEIAIHAVPTATGGVKIAWGTSDAGKSLILTGELVETDGRAVLADRRTVYEYDHAKAGPTGPTFAETYNFRRDGSAISFWSVDKSLNGEMYEVNLANGQLRNLSNNPVHDETHFFPDERYGLEESNRASDPAGPLRGISGLEAGGIRAIAGLLGHDPKALGNLDDYAPSGPNKGVGRKFDLFVTSMTGQPRLRRLTAFSDIGGAAHQSVVAPDGRRIAFALQAPPTGPYQGKGGLYIGHFGPK